MANRSSRGVAVNVGRSALSYFWIMARCCRTEHGRVAERRAFLVVAYAGNIARKGIWQLSATVSRYRACLYRQRVGAHLPRAVHRVPALRVQAHQRAFSSRIKMRTAAISYASPAPHAPPAHALRHRTLLPLHQHARSRVAISHVASPHAAACARARLV